MNTALTMTIESSDRPTIDNKIGFTLSFGSAYEIREFLKAKGYTFNADTREWQKSFSIAPSRDLNAVAESFRPYVEMMKARAAEYGIAKLHTVGAFSGNLLIMLLGKDKFDVNGGKGGAFDLTK